MNMFDLCFHILPNCSEEMWWIKRGSNDVNANFWTGRCHNTLNDGLCSSAKTFHCNVHGNTMRLLSLRNTWKAIIIVVLGPRSPSVYF